MKEDDVESSDAFRSANEEHDGDGRDRPVIVWNDIPELRSLISVARELSERKPFRTVRALCFDWAILGAALLLGTLYPYVLVWIPLIVIIAARQHALAILMHDVAHYSFLTNRKVADAVSNMFMAYPVLLKTEGYRNSHVRHHRNLFTERDPDWIGKKGHPDWDFPQKK